MVSRIITEKHHEFIEIEIDDESLTRDMVMRELKSFGHKAIGAFDGIQGPQDF
jgi:hypothetical protein